MSNSDIDPKLMELIKQTSDKVGILTSQGADAYRILMQLVGKQIRAKNPVLLPNMGLFYISPEKTYRRISRMLASMRNRESGKNPEGMTREEVCVKIKKYWEYHNIARTHIRRTGRKYRAELNKISREKWQNTLISSDPH